MDSSDSYMHLVHIYSCRYTLIYINRYINYSKTKINNWSLRICIIFSANFLSEVKNNLLQRPTYVVFEIMRKAKSS